MCGIIGYIGDKKVVQILLKGLKTLEYRGYDSCGIAVVENHELKIIKTVGEVAKLIEKTKDFSSHAQIGIGHTRWATHGKPSNSNAHPHTDCQKRIAVVHNGIIENYLALKNDLLKKGHRFWSETDTEILPHLIEEELKVTPDLFKSVQKVLRQIIGAYGIVVISADFPDQIIAARVSSPLVLGFGKGENLVASDQPALLPYTKNLGSLKDNQVAQITKTGIRVVNIHGQAEDYLKIIVEEEQKEVEKGNFAHFMLKEIHEQPKVIEDGLRGRFHQKTGVKLGGIESKLELLQKTSFLPLICCGTSLHAGLIGKEYLQNLANLPVMIEDATELVVNNFPWPKNEPAFFVSQSGETADVLSVMRKAKKAGTIALGLVNVVGSSLSRETEAGIYTRAGFEIGVAASKTFSAQILVFLLMALRIQENKKTLKHENTRTRKPFENTHEKQLNREIEKIPQFMQNVLNREKEIRKLAEKFGKKEKIYFLGRGLGYALSLEAALKVKELAYLPSEGIAMGELKHGPLALVDKNTVLVFFMPEQANFTKNLNSLSEAVSRGGRIIIITNRKDPMWKKIKAEVFYFDSCDYLLSVFPIAVWVQLFAYYLALNLGCSIDKPRNLAKSVTVE